MMDIEFKVPEQLSDFFTQFESTEFVALALPEKFPDRGMGSLNCLNYLSPQILGGMDLGSDLTCAHMDPPTPWVTWVCSAWNAKMNQNMLHPALSRFASVAEQTVLNWITPLFEQSGGHFCAGSTLANLTALWVARDLKHVKRVYGSRFAHLSIEKACKILGLEWIPLEVDKRGRLELNQLQGLDLERAALVLTAGTTNCGALDPIPDFLDARVWLHLDAAWGGGLRFSPKLRNKITGLERIDSVALSAHKWLFQPKESALVMFKNWAAAQDVISFGGAYLAQPNVGVQGSRGAVAINLLATFLSMGAHGLAHRIEHLYNCCQQLATVVSNNPNLMLWNEPESGVCVFRHRHLSHEDFISRLPNDLFSSCRLDGAMWIRAVFANPNVDIEAVCALLAAI